MQQRGRLGVPVDAERHVQRRVQRLQHALRREVATLHDRAEVPVLVGQRLAARVVDAGDLEQAEVLRAGVDARLRRVHEPGQQRRAEQRLVRRHRVGQPDRVVARVARPQAPGVRLGETRADERVLDDAAEPLLLRQAGRARDGGAAACAGTRSSTARATSSTRSISRVTSRARHVGTVTSPVLTHLEAEAVEDRALLLGRHLQPDDAVAALRPEVHDGSLRQPVVDVRRAGHARASELDEELAREHRRRLGQVRVDALLPAVRALRAQPEPLRALELPIGSKFAASSSTAVVVSVTSVSRPPISPASATGRWAVGEHEVALVQLAELPVERPQLLAFARAPDHDAAIDEGVQVEGVQRAAEGQHHVVGHVDDVRDRAHARGLEPRAQPDRRGRHRDVAEDAADVAWAGLAILDPARRRTQGA
jgi:hypothetical protein